MVWYDMVWYNTEWYDRILYNFMWLDMIKYVKKRLIWF